MIDNILNFASHCFSKWYLGPGKLSCIPEFSDNSVILENIY